MQSPQEVVDFSNNLIDAVQKATGHRLDMTPETLPILDYYCKIFRDSEKKDSSDDKTKGKYIAQLIAPMAGAYFGEVILKKYNCVWFAPPQQYGRWRIQFKDCFLFFNPVAVAMEILSQNEVEGWSSAYVTRKMDEEWICSDLDQWDLVRQEDYFSFSVRWEILDTVVNKLITAELLSRGEKNNEEIKVYSDKDYEDYICSQLDNKMKEDLNESELE